MKEMSFNNVVYAANEQAPKSKSRTTLEVQTESMQPFIWEANSGGEAELVNIQGFSGMHDSIIHYTHSEHKKPPAH